MPVVAGSRPIPGVYVKDFQSLDEVQDEVDAKHPTTSTTYEWTPIRTGSLASGTVPTRKTAIRAVNIAREDRRRPSGFITDRG